MLLLLPLISVPFFSHGAIDWVADAMPATIHANFEADAFTARGAGGKEVVSLVSSVPSLSTGIAFEFTEGFLDIQGGAGMLLNARLSSYMLYGIAGLYIESKPSVLIGPHVALTYFTEPEWWGDCEIQFSDAMGFMIGMHVTMGDRISYLFAVDYTAMEFDIEYIPPGWTVNHDTLDMTGISVQFGVRAQF